VSQKNVPPLVCYNFDTRERILVFFGRNVTDKVSNEKTLYYAISNNVCFCTTWQNGQTRKSHFFTQMLCQCIARIQPVAALFLQSFWLMTHNHAAVWLHKSCNQCIQLGLLGDRGSHQGTYKALRHGSHSFTCKQHHACLSFLAFTRCHHHSNWGSRHPIAAHYSFIDPERMKGW